MEKRLYAVGVKKRFKNWVERLPGQESVAKFLVLQMESDGRRVELRVLSTQQANNLRDSYAKGD